MSKMVELGRLLNWAERELERLKSMRTREEHLEICKKFAREYLDRGDVANAITSMLSDLGKHPETKGIADKMSILGMFYIVNQDLPGARDFIEGFR